MSGIFPITGNSAPTGFYNYNINQSLRFEDGDTPMLSRSFSAGNQRTFTFSAWVKMSSTTAGYLFHTNLAGNNAAAYLYFSNNTLNYWDGSLVLATNAIYRDPNSWFHVILAVDTTQSTSGNRAKLYVNGERISDFSTESQKTQNYGSYYNQAVTHYIAGNNSSITLDGYMAEVHFVDGTQLDQSSFGETKAGVWIPKNYAGSHGTTGFYLPFDDSSALGDDESANTNDWTPSGFVASDVVPDSPTNNWCIISPVASLATVSEGGLKCVTVSSGYGSAVGSMGQMSGKWYWEVIPVSNVSGAPFIGVVDETYDSVNSGSAVGYLLSGGKDSIGYYTNGSSYVNGTANTSYGASYAGDDIIGVALNLDGNEITFYKNGVSQGAISHTFSGGNILPAVSDGTNSALQTFAFNFGQDSSFAGTKTAQGNKDANGNGDFHYSVPSGFLALCSANLPDPAIDPAEDEEPADYFDTQLWVGNGSGQTFSNFTFQPDWLWFKNRNGGSDHAIFDSIRGVNAGLSSNNGNTENTNASSSQDLVSFDSDGFTTGTPSQYGSLGSNTLTIVTWAWKGAGSASSNGNGTIASSVSASPESGFSIVSYTGNGTAGATVGHGLSSTPEMYIVKSRSLGTGWVTYHKDAAASPEDGYLILNGVDGFFDTIVWNDTAPTNSVFSLGGTGYSSNNSGATYIAYCFHSVDGYSKVGSYTGNGSTNGTFVYTGFRPAWVLIKSTGASSNGWYIYDNKRENYGTLVDAQLYANLSSAEDNGNRDLDFTSNGFKPRLTDTNVNGSGTKFIYLAFAEQPFKYANAR